MPPLFTRPFVLLACAQALFGLSFSTYFLLPKYLAMALGSEPAEIGLVAGASWVATVLLAPFTGDLVDRFGRRRFVVAGALLSGAGALGFAFLDAVGPAMLAARIVQGVGFSFFFVGTSTIAADITPPERLGQALGVMGGTMLATQALSPPIGEWAAGWAGWRAVFVSTALLPVLAALAIVPVARRLRVIRERSRSSALRVAARVELRPIWIAIAIPGLLFGAMNTFSAPVALERGIPEVSVFFVAYALAGIAVRFGFGGLGDRLGHLRVARTSMALYAGAPLLMLGVGSYGLALPGVALGIAHGLYYPTLNALALEQSPETDRGKVVALYNGAFNVGFVAGSAGLGPLVPVLGYDWTFTATALLALPALVLLRGMAQRARERRAGPRDAAWKRSA